jgi:outer membrane protein OmpA-like peptidoglycan-associated protein
MRDRMNWRRAGGAVQLAALAAALLMTLRAGAAAPADSAAATALHVPWSVRHELNRAEAVLRREDARRHVGGEVQVLRESEEEVVLRVPAGLLFSPDSESLRPGLKAAEMLSVPSTLLRQRRHLMTRIEVYTDNIGGVQLNQQLSARRAAALANAMLTAGISAHRVQAYGRGAAEALAGNDSAQGRTLNRRVEFIFARIGSHAALAPPPATTPAPSPADAAGASAALRPAPAATSAGD